MARYRAVAEELPSQAPAAPWHSHIDALLWVHRATLQARAALPAALSARPSLALTVGGLVSYRSGPVGPYRELFGAPVVLRGRVPLTHVAFMAVDSAASVEGGRRNWALPKVSAQFEGDPGRPGGVRARGEGWALDVTARARRRRLPAWCSLTCVQVWPDGVVRAFNVRMRGRWQVASVDVEHPVASAVATWLSAGRHRAVLFSGEQDVGAPRP